MLDNEANDDAASNVKKNTNMLNTTAYDAVTEVLSHGINHFQYLEEFFKSKADEKGYSSYSFCYPTALLNYAKTGPSEEVFNTRSKILNEIYLDIYANDYQLSYAHELLDNLNIAYPFVYMVKCCDHCLISRVSYNYHSLNLLELSKDDTIWKSYSKLEILLDRYFARKTKQCQYCIRNCSYYFADPGYLLNINVEILYKCVYEIDSNTLGDIMKQVMCKPMVRNTLENLPVKLTIQGGTYVLYAVIERTPDEKYVAYCRNPDNTWVKRDSFEGEKKEVTDLSVDSIALIFYAYIGSWDQSKRKSLRKPATSAWNKLTNIELPDLCLEKIFSFLDNNRLKFFIESVNQKDETSFSTKKSEEDTVSIHSLDDFSSEYVEQRRRFCNVLIDNLPINDDVTDTENVKTILSEISIIDVNTITVRRSDERPKKCEFPTTIVTFPSNFEADWCFMNRKKLLPLGIRIRRDYTEWQKCQLKKLKDFSKKYNKTHCEARKAAKMIGGMATLVDEKDVTLSRTATSSSTNRTNDKKDF